MTVQMRYLGANQEARPVDIARISMVAYNCQADEPETQMQEYAFRPVNARAGAQSTSGPA